MLLIKISYFILIKIYTEHQQLVFIKIGFPSLAKHDFRQFRCWFMYVPLLVKWYCMPDTWELFCPISWKFLYLLASYCFFFSFFPSSWSSVFFFLDVVNPNFDRNWHRSDGPRPVNFSMTLVRMSGRKSIKHYRYISKMMCFVFKTFVS